MKLSVVLGSYNRRSFLESTIKSIRNNKIKYSYEIIVVDGGSTDGSLNWLIKQKDIITIVQHNRGTINNKPIERKSWGYFMNLAFKSAKGEYILMISDDCLLVPEAINNGIEHSERLMSQGRNIGALAFYWRNWPYQVEYHVGITFEKMFVNHGLYLTSALEEISWLNEDDYHFYHGDGDLSLKLWEAGYEVVDAPDSYVEHFTHANMAVRESNLVRQKADWDRYNAIWTHKNLPGKKYSGDWLFKLFNDTSATALNFPATERFKLKLKSKRSKLFGLIKKFIA